MGSLVGSRTPGPHPTYMYSAHGHTPISSWQVGIQTEKGGPGLGGKQMTQLCSLV